jgi:hypothetical protein
MDFSDKELRILLQALYRFRGEVSGASQSEQNQLGVVNSVIGKVEERVGPIKAERTGFDREMEENLSVMQTGKMGVAKAKNAQKLDSAAESPKVKKGSPAKAQAKPTAKAKKISGIASKAGIASKVGATKARSK